MTASTTDAVKWAALNSNIANGVVGSADAIEAALDDMRTVVDQHASEINITEDSAGVKRQAIINGNFAVNQRGVSGTVTLAAGAYGHDRWKAGASGCTYTFATAANVTTLTITAGSLIQVIEGTNLFTGTYTLSWTGTAQGKIGAGSYGASGITGSVTGGTNLNIEFNTGTLSKVQFNAGATALPFQPRSTWNELALCQRYLFLPGTSALGGFKMTAFNSDNIWFPVPVPATLRTSPSILNNTETTHWNIRGSNSAAATGFTLSIHSYSKQIVMLKAFKTAHGLSDSSGPFLSANSDLFGFDAEL